MTRHEKMSIPADMDFSQVEGLSNEIRQKLSEHRPVNLARAGRYPALRRPHYLFSWCTLKAGLK
ncbi:MAG: hypothetical protein CM15mP74_13350 [Halieaceae bacterium]|nr:MAG: hypothetical protein CM15mP74_13350 [Halieaceae bacterium]